MVNNQYAVLTYSINVTAPIAAWHLKVGKGLGKGRRETD
jgi:hypothetical protein